MLERFAHTEAQHNLAADFTTTEARSLFATRANNENNVSHLDFSSDIYASPAGASAIPAGQREPLIESALRLASVSPNADNVAAVNAIVSHESSWNPQSVNNTDINAKEGHPSRGLMQTIPTTFQEYAVPGHNSDICDPVSNLAAGIRYAVHRYGSLEQVPGVQALAQNQHYQGY